MKFYDDEPVELDCECVAYPGDQYYIVKLPYINKEDKTIKYKKFTYCGDNECLARILLDELDMDTHYVMTGYDHECEYGDRKYDELRDEGLLRR